MVGSSRCQHLNIIHLWRAVSVIYLLYNSSINIGVTANKNMFNNNVQTLSFFFFQTCDEKVESLAEVASFKVKFSLFQDDAWDVVDCDLQFE